MSGTAGAPDEVVIALARLVGQTQAEVSLKGCHFDVGSSGRLSLHVFPTVESAREHFAANGNRFVEPRLTAYVTAPDGTVAGWTPPPPKPPILSTESLPDVADQNFIWRGYGKTSRGVVKLQVGRFVASLNVSSVPEAEQLARLVADALRAH
jgi:hypothetical protein